MKRFEEKESQKGIDQNEEVRKKESQKGIDQNEEMTKTRNRMSSE